jgi:hypothetical protein
MLQKVKLKAEQSFKNLVIDTGAMMAQRKKQINLTPAAIAMDERISKATAKSLLRAAKAKKVQETAAKKVTKAAAGRAPKGPVVNRSTRKGQFQGSYCDTLVDG